MLIKIAQINPDTQQLPESPLPWEESTDWLWIWPAAGPGRAACASGPGGLKRTTCTIGCLCKIRTAKQRLAITALITSRNIDLHGPKTPSPTHPEVPMTLSFKCAWGLHPLYTKEMYWGWSSLLAYLTMSRLKGLFCKNTGLFISHPSQPCWWLFSRSFRNDYFVFLDMLK